MFTSQIIHQESSRAGESITRASQETVLGLTLLTFFVTLIMVRAGAGTGPRAEGSCWEQSPSPFRRTQDSTAPSQSCCIRHHPAACSRHERHSACLLNGEDKDRWEVGKEKGVREKSKWWGCRWAQNLLVIHLSALRLRKSHLPALSLSINCRVFLQPNLPNNWFCLCVAVNALISHCPRFRQKSKSALDVFCYRGKSMFSIYQHPAMPWDTGIHISLLCRHQVPCLRASLSSRAGGHPILLCHSRCCDELRTQVRWGM